MTTGKFRVTAKQLLAVVIPLALIIGVIVIAMQPSPLPSHTPPYSSPTSAAHQKPSSAPLPATAKENELGINTDGFNEKVYLLEEALDLPTSTKRDQKIRALSTAEGFASTKQQETGPLSNAEKAAQGMEFKAIRGCQDCIQIEPLDSHTLSVFSRIQVESYRGGRLVNTIRHERITMWTNLSGEWKFAGEQPM